MVDRRTTMMDPPIEALMDKVGSKFGLVSLAAKRGRQINSYYNQLGEGLGAIVPPQVTSVARKPLSIAFEEIAADKIVTLWDGDATGDDVDAEVAEGSAEPSEAAESDLTLVTGDAGKGEDPPTGEAS